MRLFASIVVLLLAGCNGDADTGADTDTDTDTDGPAGGVCDDVPVFDLGGMSCAQLGTAFESTMDASDICAEKKDCDAIRAPCESWNAVSCWYVANDCADGVLSDFTAEIAGMSCEINATGAVNQCTCPAAPDVDCVSGNCQFVYSY